MKSREIIGMLKMRLQKDFDTHCGHQRNRQDR